MCKFAGRGEPAGPVNASIPLKIFWADLSKKIAHKVWPMSWSMTPARARARSSLPNPRHCDKPFLGEDDESKGNLRIQI